MNNNQPNPKVAAPESPPPGTQIRVSVERGTVRVEITDPDAWFSLAPDGAHDMAVALLQASRVARAQGTSPIVVAQPAAAGAAR